MQNLRSYLRPAQSESAFLKSLSHLNALESLKSVATYNTLTQALSWNRHYNS